MLRIFTLSILALHIIVHYMLTIKDKRAKISVTFVDMDGKITCSHSWTKPLVEQLLRSSEEKNPKLRAINKTVYVVINKP